jgi:hypothetical protein
MLLSALANFASPTVGERFFLVHRQYCWLSSAWPLHALRRGSALRRRNGGEQTLGSSPPPRSASPCSSSCSTSCGSGS